MKTPSSFPGRPGGLFGAPAAAQAQARFQQAWSLHQAGELTQALQLYEQVIALQPKHFDALHLAGVASLQLGHAAQAVELIGRALKIDRDNVSALGNRGAAYAELRDHDMALLNYNKAISLDPKAPKHYNNRGNALAKLYRLDEAVKDFDQAIALDPRYFSAYNNRGTVLGELHRHEEGVADFERAIALDPESVDAHWNLGMALLRLGRFERGWQESEWRLKRHAALGLKAEYKAPRWTGAETLEGQTILVCSEQGLGDTIQFCRYVPMLAQRGARVLFEVQPAVKTLLRHLPDVTLIGQGEDVPPHDFQVPLLSLPLLFKTDLDNIPPPPDVIRADDDQARQRWQTRLGAKAKPRVGLVWSGNPDHVDDYKRSVPLKDLLPLLSDLADDIQWVSLNKDVRPSDQAVLQARPDILPLGAELRSFMDTAALSEQLDAVVSVDTSVAHLTATLGRPTLVLLPYNPDWRWLLHRSDNPWYPCSVTVLRQARPGDWASALEQLKAHLCERFALKP
jgi:Tfp pilus assembly protein PilF